MLAAPTSTGMDSRTTCRSSALRLVLRTSLENTRMKAILARPLGVVLRLDRGRSAGSQRIQPPLSRAQDTTVKAAAAGGAFRTRGQPAPASSSPNPDRQWRPSKVDEELSLCYFQVTDDKGCADCVTTPRRRPVSAAATTATAPTIITTAWRSCTRPTQLAISCTARVVPIRATRPGGGSAVGFGPAIRPMTEKEAFDWACEEPGG